MQNAERQEAQQARGAEKALYESKQRAKENLKEGSIALVANRIPDSATRILIDSSCPCLVVGRKP